MVPFATIVSVVGIALIIGLYVASKRRFAQRTTTCPANGEQVNLAVESLHGSPWDDEVQGYDVLRCSRFSPCTDVDCDKACAAKL